MTTIVVIDGLADKYHMYLKGTILEQYTYSEKHQFVVRNDELGEVTGHGTAICSIIAQNCEDVKIINIGIFKQDLKIPVDLLLQSLQFVYEQIECDIVNMSLGINFFNKELQNICDKLHDKGVVLVSAFDNAGSVSYPAAHFNVIGVDASLKCVKNNDFIYVENSMVNIQAKGGNQRVAWVKPAVTINQGASFAAAYVTAAVAKMLKNNITPENVLKNFKQAAKYQYLFENRRIVKDSFEIKKAAIIPYNKEVHSVVFFCNLLPFEIVDVYDIRESGNIGRQLKDVEERKKFIVKNIDNIDFEHIDTLIIGHVGELEELTHRKIKEMLVEKCIEYRINIYAFDSSVVSKYEEQCRGKIKLYYPHIDSSERKFGKLYKVKRPVLAVFGTSKQQGKFTLQLQLRKGFIKRDYNVCQLGTEPSAKLFGMDEVYPFGYAGECLLGSAAIEYINSKMHNMDIKEPDIIIAGSQSGTIPRLYNNVGQMSETQLCFLMGVNPDAVILCINIDDTLSYIKRTISAIESIGNCKVILIAIFPMMYVDGWGIINGKKKRADIDKIKNLKELLWREFAITSIVIRNEEEEDKLIQTCVDFFKKD